MRIPRKNTKAFTMIELIVVIVILGILALIAIPTFARVIDRTKDETAGISLSNIARDAQALNAFTPEEPYNPEDIYTAVAETKGAIKADHIGVYASGDTEQFTVTGPNLEAGASTAGSTSYGTISAALNTDASIVGLAMKSTTGRCVYVKAAATSDTLWMISKNKPSECGSEVALTIVGSPGDTFDPDIVGVPGDGDGSGTPGDGDTGTGTPEDGEVGNPTPLPLDPSDPDSPTFTGVYCEDNNCVEESLLQAESLKADYLTDDTGYLSLTVDSDHQQLIASKADGLYFVDLTSGDSTKVYNSGSFTDLVYFRGGYLFANDNALFQKFKVTASGVTLVDDTLAGLTMTVGGSSETFEINSWYSRTMTGDVVSTGAQLYFATTTAMPFDGQFNPSADRPDWAIGKYDIAGNIRPEAVAYVPYNSETEVCAISSDKNYLYVTGSMPETDDWNSEEVTALWQLDKNSNNVNLDTTAPLTITSAGDRGCMLDGNAEFTALGEKILSSNHGTSATELISTDKDGGDIEFLAGEGDWWDSEGPDGVGRSAGFSDGTRRIAGIAGYQNKIYMTTSSEGSRIRVLTPALEEHNLLEQEDINVTTSTPKTLLAQNLNSFDNLVYNPNKNTLHINGYIVNSDGTTTETGSAITPGPAYAFGDVIKSGEQIGWLNNSSMTNLWSSSDSCHANGSNYGGVNTTRDYRGALWCIDENGVSSYELIQDPDVTPVAGLAGTIAGNTILRVAVDGDDVHVIVATDDEAPYEISTYHIDLGVSTPTMTLIDSFTTEQYPNSSVTIAVSDSGFYLPTEDGIVKVSKSGGHELVVDHPTVTEDAWDMVYGVAHDGSSLYYVTTLGEMYKVG